MIEPKSEREERRAKRERERERGQGWRPRNRDLLSRPSLPPAFAMAEGEINIDNIIQRLLEGE